jgi:hypothetical protein
MSVPNGGTSSATVVFGTIVITPNPGAGITATGEIFKNNVSVGTQPGLTTNASGEISFSFVFALSIPPDTRASGDVIRYEVTPDNAPFDCSTAIWQATVA